MSFDEESTRPRRLMPPLEGEDDITFRFQVRQTPAPEVLRKVSREQLEEMAEGLGIPGDPDRIGPEEDRKPRDRTLRGKARCRARKGKR